ncbi:hypothetical protein ACETU7_10555 [Rhodococcus sp. 3Y1]
MTLIGRGAELGRPHDALGIGQIRTESTVAIREDGPVDGSRRSGVERHPDFSGLMVMCCSRESFRSTAIRANP